MQHLDPVSLAGMVAAAALALTRLLTTAKPLWDRLPPWLQGLVPALVLVLPQIAAQAAGVHTSLDLVNLLVLAAALIMPGAHSHTVGGKPGGGGAVVGLALVFALSFSAGLACSPFKVDWPKLIACTDPLRPGLVKVVIDILASNGDAEADLAALAKTEGPLAVECAVQQAVDDIGSSPMKGRQSRVAERGRAFLEKVRQ